MSDSNMNKMGWKTVLDSKVDPSGIKQSFTKVDLVIHCCRYWKLSEWDFNNLSFPFWRLYYNSIAGASIQYKDQTIALNDEKIVLIPPYTPFSTALKNNGAERLSGNRIESIEELELIPGLNMIDHYFVHFNLGFQLDHLEPGFYVFKVNNELNSELKKLRYSLIHSVETISIEQTLGLHSLILKLIAQIDPQKWTLRSIDVRIKKVLEFVQVHYNEELSNDRLASLVSMATNSFLRLFKQEMAITLQQYVQKIRIEKASLELHNANLSIDQIATQCGFSDRHHFSKVFKRVVSVPPGQYRKSQTL